MRCILSTWDSLLYWLDTEAVYPTVRCARSYSWSRRNNPTVQTLCLGHSAEASPWIPSVLFEQIILKFFLRQQHWRTKEVHGRVFGWQHGRMDKLGVILGDSHGGMLESVRSVVWRRIEREFYWGLPRARSEGSLAGVLFIVWTVRYRGGRRFRRRVGAHPASFARPRPVHGFAFHVDGCSRTGSSASRVATTDSGPSALANDVRFHRFGTGCTM
jgi:hypothetical protein